MLLVYDVPNTSEKILSAILSLGMVSLFYDCRKSFHHRTYFLLLSQHFSGLHHFPISAYLLKMQIIFNSYQLTQNWNQRLL